jgi:hypothetical protein
MGYTFHRVGGYEEGHMRGTATRGKVQLMAGSPRRRAGKPRKAAGQGGAGFRVSALHVAFTVGLLLAFHSIASKASQPPQAPPREPAALLVLGDGRCGNFCDVSDLVSKLRGLIPNLTVVQLDVSSHEGAGAYAEAGVRYLPALLFNRSIEGSSAYPQLARSVSAAGPYLSLAIGASWDPHCDPSTDYCGDARCAGRVSCRPEIPGRLEAFVMSRCPYGVGAIESMREVLDGLGSGVDFSIRFIGGVDKATGELNSLHGKAELEEDARQACAMRHYPGNRTYLRYVWCMGKGVGDWRACAASAGLDPGVIEDCAGGPEGLGLLAADFNYSASLGISASPTFLANNRVIYVANNPTTIREGFCSANMGFAGCPAQ